MDYYYLIEYCTSPLSSNKEIYLGLHDTQKRKERQIERTKSGLGRDFFFTKI